MDCQLLTVNAQRLAACASAKAAFAPSRSSAARFGSAAIWLSE